MKYLKLMRIKQWYKNLFIFLPVFFSGNFFDINFLESAIIGFFAISFTSSLNYVINDWVDRKKDMKHPEKKNRPIASGKVSGKGALIFGIILALLAIILTMQFSYAFASIVITLFVLTQLYSFGLKNEPILDLVMISINFVLRAIAGAFVVGTSFSTGLWVSPWLIICPFFLSIFLVAGKRRSDNLLNVKSYKPVLKYYTPALTAAIMQISITVLIMSYSLYSFLSLDLGLITLPVAIYSIFRYYYLIESGSKIPRHMELFYQDKRLVFGILIWVFMLGGIIYAF